MGLLRGFSWPTLPKGQLLRQGIPLTIAEIHRPSLLNIAWDAASRTHSDVSPGTDRRNVCYADGHAKFTHEWGGWLPFEQQRSAWNWYNPALPVDLEKPCVPDCAAEAARE
jgi:prepilin-type processing-associated H-X9-DG protein